MQYVRMILLGILLSAVLLTGCRADADENMPAEPSIPETASHSEDMLILAGGANAYNIVRADRASQNLIDACIALHKTLNRAVPITSDFTMPGEEPVTGTYEILIGATNRPESTAGAEGLGEADYSISVEKEKLIITGGSELAVIHGVVHLIRSDAITVDESGQVFSIAKDYRYFYDGAETREDYIADPNRFLCNWILEFDVPDWMLDFEQKMAAFADSDGRLMAQIHRADADNYPENSIEAVISCIQMGVDSVEVDTRLTKDNIPVLMHDASLKRTTDWDKKAGKNGLPSSDKVYDWTLEELRQLRLKATNGVATNYVIPTVEEVFTVCRDRITVSVELKFVTDNWEDAWESYLYPLIVKTKAWRAYIIDYHFNEALQRKARSDIYAASGEYTLMNYFFRNSYKNAWSALADSLTEKFTPSVAHWNGYTQAAPEPSVAEVEDALKKTAGKIRIHVFAYASSGADESPQTWAWMTEKGLNFAMVDHALPIQKYIAETYSPELAGKS